MESDSRLKHRDRWKRHVAERRRRNLDTERAVRCPCVRVRLEWKRANRSDCGHFRAVSVYLEAADRRQHARWVRYMVELRPQGVASEFLLCYGPSRGRFKRQRANGSKCGDVRAIATCVGRRARGNDPLDGAVEWINHGPPVPWARGIEYRNQYLIDSNGNVQVAQPGTSGASQFIWNATAGGATDDGTVVWTNTGSGIWQETRPMQLDSSLSMQTATCKPLPPQEPLAPRCRPGRKVPARRRKTAA